MGVCVVSFSSRRNGNCSQIGKYVSSLLTDVTLYDFADFTINACGNCNYQCFDNGNNCPHIRDKEREILDSITNSSLTYFVVPNYCDFPCSNFFAFNERSLCYFSNNEKLLTAYLQVPKKFIVVSNGSVINFKTAFSYHTDGEADILRISTKRYGKSGTEANLLTSAKAAADLKKFVLK